MISIKTKISTTSAGLKNNNLKSKLKSKLNLPSYISKSKAESYKKECLEALMSGTVYNNAKEMMADSKNW